MGDTRFLPYSSSHPAQPFRPSSGSSDPAYTARFPGQQPPFRPPGPGEPFSSTQPFPTHGPVFGPRMPGQEGFSSYPSPQHPGVRPPMSREGSYSGPGWCTSQTVTSERILIYEKVFLYFVLDFIPSLDS